MISTSTKVDLGVDITIEAQTEEHCSRDELQIEKGCVVHSFIEYMCCVEDNNEPA
jgi:hypothetical protein